MQRILFTGPRKLTTQQREKVVEISQRYLPNHLGGDCSWILGDAPGVDTVVANLAHHEKLHCQRFEVNPSLEANPKTKKWAYAERSQRMVNSLSAGDIAVGFPNKSCPSKCTPKYPWSGTGSGT